jgi:hypothetical protein
MALPNAEKLTSQMAMLPDQALKQMAMMHKNDPYVLPLIISEDGRRKQMRQAAQAQMGGMPQPKVADAAIANMDAQPVMTGAGVPLQTGYGGRVQTELPEDQGIARIPAPNMQSMADGGIAGYGDDEGMAQGGMFDFAQRSEPVLRMAGGGVPGYKKGGLTEKQEFAMQYKDVAEKVGRELGVDPGILISQWGLETAWGTKTVGQYNFGNIKDVTGKGPKAYDKMEKSRDSYKSYDSPEAFAADYTALIKRNFPKAVGAGSDIGVFSAGLQSGVKGAYATDPNYRKSLASTFNSLPSIIPSAQAGESPKPAAPDLASQIPGQRTPAPASTYDQTNSYFGRLADTLGIPPEYQRNIANTLNATSGFTSPISTANRAIGTTSKALEATPEMIANAEKAKQIAETQRLLPPAKAGLEALDEASQATRAAAEAARRARGVEQDVQAAKAAEQSIDAANMTSKIARTTEEAIAAGPNARALDSAKLANASKALAGTQLAEEKAKGLFAEGTRPEVGESVSGTYSTALPPAVEAEPKPSDVIAAAKEAVPAKERKGFDGEDLLMLGLNLMANKSPRFLSALGEAGIQTLTAKKEREKSATDLEYKDIMSKYYGSLGKKAEADAAYIASGEKGRMADRLKAATLIDRDLESWRKTMEGSMPQPGTEAAKRKELTNYYFGLFGLDVPATMASTAGVAIPEGVKVTRS